MHIYSRTIRLLLVSALLLFLVVGNGCDKDNGVEPEKNQSIIGAWRMVSVILKDTPIGNLTLPAAQFLEMSGTGATTSTMRFNEDGSASLTTTYADSADDVVAGTWSKDGDKLTIGGAGIDDTVGYKVDGSTLTLTMMMPIDFNSDGTAEDTEIDMVYTKL
jgi:hypothetical protein